MAALDELKAKGIQGHWATPVPVHRHAAVPVAASGSSAGRLFDEMAPRRCSPRTPGVKALTWLIDLVKKGYSPKNVAQDADVIALQNGKTAFNWNGIWTSTRSTT